MDIDLVNDLRLADESDEDNDKFKENDSENDESEKLDVENVMKKANEVVKKKVIRRPRPKLDVDRLIGRKGLDELCYLMKNEKFKGKGYEFADLDTLMHKVEYWAHRLVPHMAFDDFIEKAESLSNKRPIKNILQNLHNKLNIQTSSDHDKETNDTLIDLLPNIARENHDNTLDRSDIPNDDELYELLQ